jgi:hypothetical protein
MGVAATARCKNAGMALRPTMATPPCFKKYRRENLMCCSFCLQPSIESGTDRHQLNIKSKFKLELASLKFRSAEDQAGNYSKVNLFYWIVELGLQDLRAVQLLL